MTAFDSQRHWDDVYERRAPGARSWFQERPTVSLELIGAVHLPAEARVLDVGGGTSRLADALLDQGYRDLTILDVSARAVAEARARLGGRAAGVHWIAGDITGAPLSGTYDFWHDRAVFHFLVAPDERARYVAQLERHTRPGSYTLIATFASDGPEKCSGLPVVRYEPDTLTAVLGRGYELIDQRHEAHRTPSGATQKFQYSLLRRV